MLALNAGFSGGSRSAAQPASSSASPDTTTNVRNVKAPGPGIIGPLVAWKRWLKREDLGAQANCQAGAVAALPRSPRQRLVIVADKTAGGVASGAVDHAAHAGNAFGHGHAGARLGLGPARMQRQHADRARREVDRQRFHHHVEAGLA